MKLTHDRDLLGDPIIIALLDRIPDVQVRIDDHLETQALASVCGDDPTPRITLGAALVHASDRRALYGALAHEVAHHLLGHIGPPRRPLLVKARALLQLAAPSVAAFAVGCGALLVALLVLVADVTATAVVAWCDRRAEVEADAFSVRLLIDAGLPGAEVVEASLVGQVESWWERLTWWAWSSHPSLAVRRRVVRSAR